MAQFVARKDKDGPFLALRWRLGFVNFMEILHWCRFRLETPLQHRIEVSFLCDFRINSSIDVVHRPANVNNFHSRVIWRNFINFIFVRHRIALDITRRPVLFKKKKKKKIWNWQQNQKSQSEKNYLEKVKRFARAQHLVHTFWRLIFRVNELRISSANPTDHETLLLSAARSIEEEDDNLFPI